MTSYEYSVLKLITMLGAGALGYLIFSIVKALA